MTNTETVAEAWRRRTTHKVAVDFTMMYVAHDAFNRDLARLVEAARAGKANSPEAKATWAEFSKQLITHHHAEDESLWPRVREAIKDVDEFDVLEQMQAEHETLDPLIERIDDALAVGEYGTLAADLDKLATHLAAHMRHEEEAALPIVARRIGTAGWAAFGKDIRRAQGGIKAGRTYLPWVLDGAPELARTTVLRVLPPPVRVLYRRVWEPAYQRSIRLR